MKKIQVIWTDESFFDLELIFDFIASKSSTSAKKVIQSILSRIQQLETFPNSGTKYQPKLNTGRHYRYLVEGYFKIIYSLDNSVLYIESIIDTRRNPNSLKL